MADTKMFPVDSNFDMEKMVRELTEMYQAKGFNVTVMQIGTGVSINFEKDNDGIKKFIGLALCIKANITINDDRMIINFTDAEWMGKIMGGAIGFFLCLVPAFIAGYGAMQQFELPKKIGNDIQILIVGGAKPFV